MTVSKIYFILYIFELLIITLSSLVVTFFYLDLATIIIFTSLFTACIYYIRIQRKFNYLSYQELSNLLKIKQDADFIKNIKNQSNTPTNSDELTKLKRQILVCVFLTHPNTRKGFRALIGCILSIAILIAGVDYLILYIAIAILFLYGICKVIQGAMDTM